MDQAIIESAKAELHKLMVGHDIGGHGIDHMLKVAEHASNALEYETLSPQKKLQIYLAALLHDADDDKIFKSENYENARQILAKLFIDHDVKEDIIEMISLVSCSKNGDSVPREPYMVIPRDCDRLEAIGEIGIERCLEYSQHIGNPLHADTTPRVYTREELWKVATAERFANYKRSASVIDHYYDKLLHIGQPDKLKSGNKYILMEAMRRNEVMIDYVLNYWRNVQ